MSNAAARRDILRAIRSNLSASRRHDELREHDQNPVLPAPLRSVVAQPACGGLVDMFCTNLIDVGGRVTVVANVDDARSEVKAIVKAVGPKRIAISDAPLVQPLVGGLGTGIEILQNARANELFDCDLGITSAQWAIAETGTLVLESEAEFARLASLVPDTHICVIEATKIKETMADVLDKMQAQLRPAVTFITGPSRTSDIELKLAIGVHGPRELHVIVIDEAATSNGS